uniref:Rho-GAP domain-containing protein n=1 Tax=Schistosoma mansoni TaxID=6183 RepID=A0A5K4F178_SCHMA
MSNLSEDISISKRPRIFRGRGAQQRSDVKKKARRNQSTGDIIQSAREQTNIQSKDENTNPGKKVRRWLRLLKMTSISATTAITLDGLRTENNHSYNHQTNHHHHHNHNHQYPDNSNSPPQEMQSFLGNLGIGAYVGDEENAFVNSDNSEEIHVDQLNKTNKPLSKSMINLSSVSLLPSKRKTSDQINEPETLLNDASGHCSRLSSSRVSCLSNTSSSSPQSTTSFTRSQKKPSISEITNAPTSDSGMNQFNQTEFYESMPLILKTVINQTSLYNNVHSMQRYNVSEGYASSNLTPKLSTSTITGTNSHHQSGENINVKRTIHYPAWMIISDEQLQLDTTYSFYRIADYLKELYLAESWLENLLISDILPSRSYSPVRQPTDYRSRRARLENNPIMSHKILKRTCSEQRYDETQLIGGLWDRREMDLIQKLIRRAISIIESKISSTQADEKESSYSATTATTTTTLSAIIFKNASTEKKLVPSRRKSILTFMEVNQNRIPISLRSFIPDCEKITGNHENTVKWKKIYAEEIVNIIKLPRYPVEQHLNLETIHQSQKSTIFLCSDHLVLTQWPLDPQSFVCNGDLAHIIPFYELWCDTLKLDELLCIRSSSSMPVSKSLNHHHKFNSNIKNSEIDNDHLIKYNISSSSGMSTVSLLEGDPDLLNSPSFNEHYNQFINDTEIIKTSKSSYTSNDNHTFNNTDMLLLIGHPPMENWAIRFSNNNLCEKWRNMINESIRKSQQIFCGKSINVKVINQIIPNHQVIYKYHNISVDMTIDHLKDKSLEGLNININNTKADLYLRYIESHGEEREILMYGPENPFLIALSSVQLNSTDSALSTPKSATSAFNTISNTTNISNITGNNSPDSNTNHYKDILDLIKKASISPQSENRTTDHNHNNSNDYIISRDQIKISFVLRPVDKYYSTEDNQPQHHYQKVTTKSDMKSTEYMKQERGRSTAKSTSASRNRRNDMTQNNNMMTKSSIFLNHNNANVTKQNTSTNVPLRGAISTSSLQIGTTQEIQCGQIFGRLPEQCWPDSQLPESLVNLFAIIYYNGVNVEGIFRRTAVHSQIELMRARVDENIQMITPNNCNPILASCVLKRFFCEIPGHLLIDSNWDEWASLTEINSASERLQVLERLIRSLPKVNQTLLALLIYLLAHIRDNEEINRMSARNLAVVWGPNLIQRPNSPLALSDSMITTQIITYLLEPTVTNFLLNTSNVKMELNQHFSNIWGNFLQDSNNKTKVQNTATTSTTTNTDSSDDDKNSKQYSDVHSERKTAKQHPSRRGHSVSNIPPQISSLEVENSLINERLGNLLLKTSEQQYTEPIVMSNSSSNLSINNKSNHHLNMENPSQSSLMKRRGAGRIHKKKHSFFNQLALPDQTGPPNSTVTTGKLNKQTNYSSPTDSITTELKNIIRSRTTSSIVLPLSFSVTATTPTTLTNSSLTSTISVEKQEPMKKTTPSSSSSSLLSRRSRNTSCPPSTNKTTISNDKFSVPCPLPRNQINSEAPPVPLRGQQLTHQDLRLKLANNNNNSASNNMNLSKNNSNHSKLISHNNNNNRLHEEARMQTSTPTTPTTPTTTTSPISRQQKPFHRRFRSQTSTSEIPDVTLLRNDTCRMRQDNKLSTNNNNNNNTYKKHSMDHSFSYTQSFYESFENDLSISSHATTTTTTNSSSKTNESTPSIKIISVSSSSKESVPLKPHKKSSSNHSVSDNTTDNGINHTTRSSRSIYSSTDHRSRNNNNNNNTNNNINTNNGSMLRSESDMSMISTDSSLLSFSSNSSSSSLRKHNNNKIKDDAIDITTGIPCPVVHRPEFNTTGYIINTKRKSSQSTIQKFNSPQSINDYKQFNKSNCKHPLSSQPLYSTTPPTTTTSSASSSFSSSPSPTSFSSSDIGYVTSHHENLENIIYDDNHSKVLMNCINNENRISSNAVSRMSSHASTISSGSVTVISTSTEK